MVTQRARSGGVTKILAEGREPSQQLIAAWTTASPWWSCRPPCSGSLVQPGPVSALPSSCLYNLLCQMEAVVRGGIRALLSWFFSFVGDCSNISRSPAVTERPAAQTDSSLREFSPSFHPTPHISASTVRGENTIRKCSQQQQPRCDLSNDSSFCFQSEKIHYGCRLKLLVKRLFHGSNWAEGLSDPFSIHISPHNYR